MVGVVEKWGCTRILGRTANIRRRYRGTIFCTGRKEIVDEVQRSGMSANARGKQNPVFFLSPDRLLADFLDCALQKHACGRIVHIEDREADGSRITARTSGSGGIFLIDAGCCEIISATGHWYPILRQNGRIPIALFGVDPHAGIEQDAISAGVKGFFYKTDGMALFVKGIRTLVAGELWIPRQVFTRYVFEDFPRTMEPQRDDPWENLTGREREILRMLNTGLKNEEIADRLYISTNTVRTHLHNIFKKIRVGSRLQASVWVRTHQKELQRESR